MRKQDKKGLFSGYFRGEIIVDLPMGIKGCNMNKLAKGIRWLLVTIAIVAVAVGGVLAYQALTGTGTVTVKENLSWVGSNTFTVNLYPQESVIETLTLANASSIAMEVDVTSEVLPAPDGITVTIPKKLTVPGSGELPFNIEIATSKSAVPATYTITFGIVR